MRVTIKKVKCLAKQLEEERETKTDEYEPLAMALHNFTEQLPICLHLLPFISQLQLIQDDSEGFNLSRGVIG